MILPYIAVKDLRIKGDFLVLLGLWQFALDSLGMEVLSSLMQNQFACTPLCIGYEGDLGIDTTGTLSP